MSEIRGMFYYATEKCYEVGYESGAIRKYSEDKLPKNVEKFKADHKCQETYDCMGGEKILCWEREDL